MTNEMYKREACVAFGWKPVKATFPSPYHNSHVPGKGKSKSCVLKSGQGRAEPSANDAGHTAYTKKKSLLF